MVWDQESGTSLALLDCMYLLHDAKGLLSPTDEAGLALIGAAFSHVLKLSKRADLEPYVSGHARPSARAMILAVARAALAEDESFDLSRVAVAALAGVRPGDVSQEFRDKATLIAIARQTMQLFGPASRPYPPRRLQLAGVRNGQ